MDNYRHYLRLLHALDPSPLMRTDISMYYKIMNPARAVL